MWLRYARINSRWQIHFDVGSSRSAIYPIRNGDVNVAKISFNPSRPCGSKQWLANLWITSNAPSIWLGGNCIEQPNENGYYSHFTNKKLATYVPSIPNTLKIHLAIWWPILSIRICNVYWLVLEKKTNHKSSSFGKISQPMCWCTYNCSQYPISMPLHSTASFIKRVHIWIVAANTSLYSGFASPPSFNAV